MEKEKNNENCDCQRNDWFKRGKDGRGGGGGAVYGFGLIGALVYYLSHVATFSAGLFGVLKSIVWPAMLVYHLFTYLHL